MKRFATALLFAVAIFSLLGTTGCREAVKRGEIDNLGRKPMFTPVAVPLLQPGDKGELLFWKNGGMFWNITAKVQDESHFVVKADQAKMLAKFWEFCSQPGFRKAGQGQPIYWLGSTGLDHDNRLSFVPNQVEVIRRDGWAPSGRVLAEYYKSKLESQPSPQAEGSYSTSDLITCCDKKHRKVFFVRIPNVDELTPKVTKEKLSDYDQFMWVSEEVGKAVALILEKERWTAPVLSPCVQHDRVGHTITIGYYVTRLR